MQRLVFALFALLAFAVCVVLATGAPEDSVPGVIDVTDKNADDVFDGSKFVFAEFYAPWCGHCKNLAPEYAKVGEAMEKAKPRDVIVAKVNCDNYRDVCSRFDVKGYPTLKFFAKSKTPEDYNKGRTAEDIIEYINEKAGSNLRVDKPPSFVTVLTPSNFDKIVMDPTKFVLVEFYAPWCGHCKRLEPDYEKLGAAFRLQKDVVIAKVDADKHRSLGEKFGVQGFPTIKYFGKGTEKKAEDYNLGRAPLDFLNFINDKVGTKRTLSGLLDDTAGKIEFFDSIAKGFAKATADERKDLLKKAEDAAKTAVDKTAASYYVRALTKLSESADYAKNEAARLQRILESGAVADDRMDDIKTRQNILSTFTA